MMTMLTQNEKKKQTERKKKNSIGEEHVTVDEDGYVNQLTCFLWFIDGKLFDFPILLANIHEGLLGFIHFRLHCRHS